MRTLVNPGIAAIRTGTWPGGCDLGTAELEELVAVVAAHPEDWRHLLAFDADERVFVSLHRDHHVDVWLPCWTQGTIPVGTTTGGC